VGPILVPVLGPKKSPQIRFSIGFPCKAANLRTSFGTKNGHQKEPQILHALPICPTWRENEGWGERGRISQAHQNPWQRTELNKDTTRATCRDPWFTYDSVL